MNRTIARDLLLLIIATLFIVIYIGSVIPKELGENISRFLNLEPKLNRQPKEKYIIEASFNTLRPLRLTLVGGYANYNPACDKTVSVLGIATHNTPQYIPIKPEIQFKILGNKAIAEVYGDSYEIGECEWGLADLKIKSVDITPSNVADISRVLPKSYYSRPLSSQDLPNYSYGCVIAAGLACTKSKPSENINKPILFTIRRIY